MKHPSRSPLLPKANAVLAWILLVNASLGVGVWASRMAFTDAATLQPGELPWFGLLGVAAGLLCLGRHTAGLWGAVLFYTMQVAIYYPVTHGWSFGIKAGISLGQVFVLSGGVLVVNYAALLLLAASSTVLVLQVTAPERRPA